MSVAESIEEYGAESIVALEGLEPVRLRPGMYIGSTGKQGYHHLLWEVVDNSVDEAMGGHCDRIDVTLNPDGSATVTDNGRGIPVAPQKSGSYRGMPTVEMALTVLHAGGKFEGKAYQFSGGLHGVGISVVNALSEWTRVEVRREGQRHTIEFGAVERKVEGRLKLIPGAVTQPLVSSGRLSKTDTGTTVTFLPDERVFSTYGWDAELIARRLRQGAFLNPGLTFAFTDNRGDTPTTVEYHYPGGLRDFMGELTEERLAHSEHAGKTELLMPQEPIVLGGSDPDIQGEWAMVLRWFPDQWYRVNSFANGIETGHGGAHVKGYEQVLTSLMNKYARQDHITLLGERDPNLEAIDVRSGLGVIVAVKIREPQFVGQTKDELSNDEVRVMMRSGFTEQFWNWMQEHSAETKAILTKVIEEMRLRHKVAALADAERAKAEKRGFQPRSMALPAKLSDCETRDRMEAELFIVEGDSAAGPAKKARDAYTQGVLPIRGKGLNIENALQARDGADRIQGNAEVQGILASLGAGSQDLFDLAAMRYGKVIILTDADDDGAHIQLLLMTLFYRLTRQLVEDGRLYVARPPLFSTTLKGEKLYVHDQAERERVEAANPRSTIEWTRFKGLGEMNYNQLGETTINPPTRHLVRVTAEEASIVDATITALMGRDTDAKWEALQSVVIDEEAALP